jgi:hypothetical protein
VFFAIWQKNTAVACPSFGYRVKTPPVIPPFSFLKLANEIFGFGLDIEFTALRRRVRGNGCCRTAIGLRVLARHVYG